MYIVELPKAKIYYFQNQIVQAASNPKTLWQMLKNITGENKKNDSKQIYLNLNGSLVTEHKLIASAFNDYFVSSVHELSSSFSSGVSTVISCSSPSFSFLSTNYTTHYSL